MLIVFEVSKPFQQKPGFSISKSMMCIWWMYFAVSLHKESMHSLIESVQSGEVDWEFFD